MPEEPLCDHIKTAAFFGLKGSVCKVQNQGADGLLPSAPWV